MASVQELLKIGPIHQHELDLALGGSRIKRPRTPVEYYKVFPNEEQAAPDSLAQKAPSRGKRPATIQLKGATRKVVKYNVKNATIRKTRKTSKTVVGLLEH